MSKEIPLLSGQYYHIYNRGNNGENLFREERNYAYFFKLYIHYIYPIADTYAYCLMRNHFHLLVRYFCGTGLVINTTLEVLVVAHKFCFIWLIWQQNRLILFILKS